MGQPKFPDSTATLISGIPAAEREFMVYLPLRNGVTSLEFGLPKGTTIKPGPTRATGSKPIVFYGTSITHGIGASRARMTHVAMLGRIFNREVSIYRNSRPGDLLLAAGVPRYSLGAASG